MITVKQIEKYLRDSNYEFEISGNMEVKIDTYSSLFEAQSHSITWAKKVSALDDADLARLDSIIIVTNGKPSNLIDSACYIICAYPKAVFFDTVSHFFAKRQMNGISATSVIETKDIGSNVSIGCYCHIGKDVTIEDNVIIHDRVVIECPAFIGAGSEIWSGVVIGTDGFGYYEDLEGHQQKVPHTGGVYIGQNVEIGANTCIDRGTIGNTTIGDRVKIDNLCHIGHNVEIAADAMIIALSLLGGSSKIGDRAYIAPGVMIMNQVSVGEDALVGMGAVVVKDVEANKIVAGVPAKVLRDNK